MTITIIDAPEALCRRLSQSWSIEARTVSGGPALSGREQVIFGPSPRWRASLTLLVNGNDAQKSFRAFIASLRGRARAVRLYPECCPPISLYERLGAEAPPDDLGLPHSDDAYFSDDSGYAWPYPVLTLADDAAAFDDVVTVDLEGHDPGIVDGDFIGIAGRLYIVTRIDASSSTEMTLAIEPPLRAAAVAGIAIPTRPSIVMRLAADREGEFSRESRLARPALELIELPEQV